MSEMSMQNFADLGKLRNLWECETGRNRISGTEELREKRKHQNEKEGILQIILNDESNIVLLTKKEELHGENAFTDTGVYTGKYTYTAKMKSGKLQITKNHRRIRRIYMGGKEAA